MSQQLNLSILGSRKYWSIDEGRLAVEGWRRSKLSPHAFAAKHAFDVQKLYWWRKKLKDATSKFRTATPPSALQLVPVAVLGQTREHGPSRIRIELEDCVIEVLGDVDEASLRHVLAAVRAC